MVDALKRQVGGSHYTDMKYQPMELCEDLMLYPAFVHVTKYLTRNKGDRKINLEKALHCIVIEYEYLTEQHELPKVEKISFMDEEYLKSFCGQFENASQYFNILNALLSKDYAKTIVLMQNLLQSPTWEQI